MGTELAIKQTEIDELWSLGSVLVQSGMFQDATQEAQAVVKVLAGRELGFSAIASMTGVYVVKGRVSLSANLMASAVKRSGKYNYRVLAMDDALCQIEFFERMDGKWESIGVSAFSAEDARRAQTQNMNKFPRNMLFARAMSNGVRWFCPDVTGGPVYTHEELGAEVDSEGELISLPQDSQQLQVVIEVGNALEVARDEYNAFARRAKAAGVPDVTGLKRTDDIDDIRERLWQLQGKAMDYAAELCGSIYSTAIRLPEEGDSLDMWLAVIEEIQGILATDVEAEEVLA